MIHQMLIGSYGGIGATLPLTIQATDIKPHPGPSSATFTMNAAGTYTSTGNTSAPTGTWALYGGAADYQFRLTPYTGTTGTFGGASTGIWVGPSASPTWSVGIPVNTDGDVLASGLLEVRDAVTLSVLASTTLTLNAITNV